MKKDQKRNKTEKALSYFPKINRFITEEWKLILSSFISGVLLFGIVFQSIELYHNLQAQGRITQERGEADRELMYWNNSLSEYPDHRDIYFKIATLEYRLGNQNEARLSLEKVLKIDPNFAMGHEMEREIGL